MFSRLLNWNALFLFELNCSVTIYEAQTWDTDTSCIGAQAWENPKKHDIGHDK